jgi:5'-deoxynucleotidase YfbR-like HD superfamily hydrolase
MGKYIEAWRNGQVTRKHTMENIRPENTAEHTWGLMMLLMIAWPNVNTRILIAAQVHDSGERATGDMPGPTKWANPELGKMMDDLEHQHIGATLPIHIVRFLGEMNACDWAIIEFFDRAEFCISMSRERRLGNTYAMMYYKRSLDKMDSTFIEHREDFVAKDPLLAENMIALRNELYDEQKELLAL